MKTITVYRDCITNRFIRKEDAAMHKAYGYPIDEITIHRNERGRFTPSQYKWVNHMQIQAYRKWKEEKEIQLFYGKIKNKE